MLRVLQVGMTRNLGGIESYLIEQFRHLDADLAFDFVNITGEHDICFSSEILDAGSEIYSVISRHKNPIKHYYQWYKIMKKNAKKYEGIVLNTNSLDYIYPLVLAKIYRIPIRAIHSHNSGFEVRRSLLRRLMVACNTRLMRWSANLYLACSRKAGEWMFKETPFEIIHNAINIKKYLFSPIVRNEVRQELNIGEKKAIVHVGRFSYQKNHKFLIEIFKYLHDLDRDTVLFLVGEDKEPSLYLDVVKEKVKAYGLENDVKFLGVRTDVYRILQGADVFLMPSYFEGLSVVAIEAQAVRLTVFLSDTISSDIKISDDVHFLSLKAGAEYWARYILDSKLVVDRSKNDVVRESNYNIEVEIKRVKAIYKQAYLELRNQGGYDATVK